MKRYGHLFDKIVSSDNLELAIEEASKGKRTRKGVSRVLANKNFYVMQLHDMLVDHEYVPNHVIRRVIRDKVKTRTIAKPQFYPDQVIQWATMLVLQPIFLKGMYEYSVGSIPHRGTSMGQKAVKKWLQNDPKNTKYCLKMDVHKFYPSINTTVLKSKFRRKIKDQDTLWLLDTLVNQFDKGLPIGFYSSQWFANFFLQDLDHYIKDDLQVPYLVRNIDDLVLLGPNKKKLHKAERAISSYLAAEDLKVKPNWQVFKVNSRPIDFLGMRLYRGHTTLRRRNVLKIKRRMAKISKKPTLNRFDAASVIAYWGWLKHSDSYGFYMKYMKPACTIKRAKEVMSRGSKR
ncbi:RNA-directed DNA polymerase [Levilactobacillus wangkuiensis]|uniref:RNA-directed DNA polymerase n=1 Tax=Levilactobacillus wangkuiensis TaxID=2799566 RepID=UPI001951FC91|nr:RNA-directed DNA polymerase [Levilactobacillus wangkuiensis]